MLLVSYFIFITHNQFLFFDVHIFKYQTSHIAPNARFALYRTMTLEQVLFIVGYALIAYPLYLANKKFAGIAVDKLLFSPREFKDE